MKLLPAAAGVLLSLIVLTGLLLRGIGTDTSEYELILRTLDDFALAEASLQRDVLQARAGLLQNYDPLVRTTQEMDALVSNLRQQALAEHVETTIVDRFTSAVTEQDALTEQFKTANALLQNSLSYFGLLSTNPSYGVQAPGLARTTGALAAAILHLIHDPSPESAQTVQDWIDQLATQAPTTGPDEQTTQALLAHARLLHNLLPQVDATLKSLLAASNQAPLEAVRAQFADHHAASEKTTQRLLLLLYLVSLLLLVLLVRLGLRLNAGAQALRRRAAFEHAIAKSSTRLINCPAEETDGQLKLVLGEFCRAIGVGRAYVVLDDKPARVIAWCAEGTTYPPGWPDQAMTLAARLGTTGPDIVAVPDIGALPPGEVRDALAAAGIRGWAFVPLVRAGQVRGILGFDAFRPAWGMVFPLPVVRLAGDAVVNALEREFLERERTKLGVRLERARRMQTIGQLASGIAHNFNNIIGAVLGYAEMAEAQATPGTELAKHVDEIRRATERGRDLIDTILIFGRQSEARARPIPVRSLLAEAASLLHASLPGTVELAIEVSPPGLIVLGKPAQLQQIVLNLCNNASQAMEGRGCVRVTAEQRDVPISLRFTHGELSAGRYVCLAVTDTGRGFDETVAPRLFEPFFTTRTGGTGLGLASVLEIIRDHDGAMNVQSEPGLGSRFEAWLPAAVEGGGAEFTSNDEPALPLGRGEIVLISENEHERLLRDEEMVAALGYEPVGFQRPDEALAAYRADRARFDAVMICDASSDRNGLHLARALHEMKARTPILLAIAFMADLGAEALADAGIAEVLRYPLDSTEVATALARCLRASDALQAQ